MGATEVRTSHRISSAGLRFIAQWEGFSGTLYNDPLGHCTIGFGHLVHHGRCNGSEPERFRRGITRRQGLTLLRKDAARFEASVDRSVRVALRRPQFDALASFAFNVGTNGFEGSTLLRRLNRGEYAAVPPELMRWTNNGLPGLVRRRRAEGALFRDGRYTSMTIGGRTDDEQAMSGVEITEGDVANAEPPADPEEGPADEGMHAPAGENPEDVGEPTDEADTLAPEEDAELEAARADARLARAMRIAVGMGLRISSTNKGGHAPGSYHFRPPCGTVVVGGRRYQVCRAFDAAQAGNPHALYRRFFERMERMRPTELFYDPMGYSWKNGQKVGWIVGGHRDHVHVAF